MNIFSTINTISIVMLLALTLQAFSSVQAKPVNRDLSPVYLPEAYVNNNETMIYPVSYLPLNSVPAITSPQPQNGIQFFGPTHFQLPEVGTAPETNVDDHTIEPLWIITVPVN